MDSADPDVQEAARFAVQTYAVRQRERVLYQDVLQAQSQVVAGLNYQLTLQVSQWPQSQQVQKTRDTQTPRMAQGVQSNSIPPLVRQATVRVWRKTDGNYTLTEWQWL